MKDRYLFRGKRIDNGEWIYGSVRQENGSAYILEPDFSILFERPDRPYLECGVEDKELTGDGYNAAWYGWEEALERYEQHFPEWVEIDPETVGQFTGLLDKNGVRIFEKNMVKVTDRIDYLQNHEPMETNYIYTVILKEGCFIVVGNKDEDYTLHDLCLGVICRNDEMEIEVIHDHPELLKEAAQ